MAFDGTLPLVFAAHLEQNETCIRRLLPLLSGGVQPGSYMSRGGNRKKGSGGRRHVLHPLTETRTASRRTVPFASWPRERARKYGRR